MKIWYVRDLEPVPTDPGNPRLLRAGLLATTLSSLGHETTWYTSTFNHYSRRQRKAEILRPSENLSIRVLPAPGYSRNISVKRVFHNRSFAQAFLTVANAAQELPDILVADLPTTDAAAAAVQFARRRGIPTVITIRDLWPDFFADFVPSALSPFAKLATLPLEMQARFACRHATSLVGISEQYLEWGREKGGRTSVEHDRIFPLGYLKPRQLESDEIDKILGQMGISSDQHIVSFVGSWGATYDLSLVSEAARLLAHRKDVVFALAGNAAERPDLERSFRKLDNTVLLGWISQPEVSALLTRSSIGLLPYAKQAPQGLPNKVYEYLAFGTFQLAILGEEAEHLYRETAAGLNVPNASPLELANAIEAVLSDSRLIKAREERIAIFNTRFDARKIYRDIADHIVKVASKKL
jgi:glycosyltransferase involved in cell wall biosynthesis